MSNDKKDYSSYNKFASERAPLPKRWFFSRIICFIIALGIWIYVVNVTTQESEKTFNLIDIKIEGSEQLLESTNMSVVNLEESKVSITVKGLRSDISQLTEKDFSAYINISKLTSVGKHDIDVSVNLPSTVSLVSTYPETVTISVDANIERVMDLEIDITGYSVDTDYKMGTPVSDINTVKITGPSEVLNRVKSAKVFVNLGTVMTSTVTRSDIILVDKVGNSIDTTYLTLDSTSAVVTVPVTMQKNITLVCGFLPGLDPSVYSLISVYPNTVRVEGDPKILTALDTLTVLALDGAERSNTVIDFSDILIPSGVKVIGAPSAVTVIAKLPEVTTQPPDTTESVTTEEITDPVDPIDDITDNNEEIVLP